MKISDIADIINVTEKNPSCSGIDVFVGLEHYDVAEPVITRHGSTEMLSTAAKKFESGDVLIARRNVYLQRAGVVHFSGLTSGDSIILRTKKNIDYSLDTNSDNIKALLPFILNTNAFWNYANVNSDGTMSKRLSPAMLLDYEFTLPPLSEQKRLAEKLWAAYEVKQSYLKMIEATDEMVKSQFIEMFKDSPRKGLGDLASFINGSAFKPNEWSTNGLPIVRIQNLTQNDAPYNYYSGDTSKKVLLDKGDILVSWSATLGIFTWEKGPALLNQHIFKVIFDKLNVERDFFIYTVKLALEKMGETAHGSTMRHVVKKDFDSTQVAYPSIVEQQRFASIAQQSDKSKFELRKSIESIDAVIKSLINS